MTRDEPRIVAPPRQDFSVDLGTTGVAFFADGTVEAGLGHGSVRLLPTGGSASLTTFQPHSGGAAILAMAVDIDGAGVPAGGDDGRVARTGSDGQVTPLAEFPGRQADVLSVDDSSGLRAATAGREASPSSNYRIVRSTAACTRAGPDRTPAVATR